VSADRYKRASSLFLEACQLPENQQAEFLQNACENDHDLLQQVTRMLAQDRNSDELPPIEDFGKLLQSDKGLISDLMSSVSADSVSADSVSQAETENLPEIDGFTITARVGKGGMGVVYRAIQHSTQRAVALKAIRFWQFASAESHRRFLVEIKLAASLEHPNIARIYDSGQSGGMPWLAMELVEGVDLSDWTQSSSLDVRAKLSLMASVCDAIGYAHRRGIIHRDLKPGNILVTSKGKPFVVDFGLARLLESDAHSESVLTAAGTLLGTPGFMSPEQARGDGPATDVRSDCYSLGSILFWMLTGQHTHDLTGSLLTVMKRVAEEEPRRPTFQDRSIDRNLEALVMKAVSLRPEQRYQTADDMAADLRRYLNGEPITATKHINMLDHENVRRRRIVTGSILTLLAVAVIIIYSRSFGVDGNKHEPLAVQDVDTETSDDHVTQRSDETSPSWHGWSTQTPAPAIAPFDATDARQHQEAWAKHLGTPVEYTNTIGMKFRLIPPGEFLMGGTKDEIGKIIQGITRGLYYEVEVGWAKSAGPAHRVALTKPIYLGVHEVTQQQYEDVVGKTSNHFSPAGAGKDMVIGLDTTLHPITGVIWYDGIEFCNQLSIKENLPSAYHLGIDKVPAKVTLLDGTGYRLPTEAIWEFSCRAGNTTVDSIGGQNEQIIRESWIHTNSSSRTHAVGQLKPNGFGLYDMRGNVWEWCQDAWAAEYHSRFSDTIAVDPPGPAFDEESFQSVYAQGQSRIIRGGCFMSPAGLCSASYKEAVMATNGNYHLGLRVSLSVEAVRQAIAAGSKYSSGH